MNNYGAYSNKNRSDIVLDEGAGTVKIIPMDIQAGFQLTHQEIQSIPPPKKKFWVAAGTISSPESNL
jgi:hypothetical protein